MLKKLTLAAINGTLGAGLGAVIGTCAVPVYICADLMAPITYPVAMTALVATHFKIYNMQPPKPVLLLSALVGALTVPFAPINLVSRPVCMPILNSLTGALTGAVIGFNYKE